MVQSAKNSELPKHQVSETTDPATREESFSTSTKGAAGDSLHEQSLDSLKASSEKIVADDVTEDEQDDGDNASLHSPTPPELLMLDDMEGDVEDEDSLMDPEDSLPLMYYTRLLEQLPRQSVPQSEDQMSTVAPLATDCTCSAMGKVILSSETTLAVPDVSNETLPRTESSSSPNESRNVPVSADLWQAQPIYLTALGFQDGSVYIVDSQNGTTVAGHDQLYLHEITTSSTNIMSGTGSHKKRDAVVALSWDSTGTVLSAIDAVGMCAVWEIRYQIQMQSSVIPPTISTATATPATRETSSNMFRTLMSAWTGGSTVQQGNQHATPAVISTSTETDEARNTSEAPSILGSVPTLTVASIQAHRVSYPKSFGVPTQLALDPSYKRRREKGLLVGFTDGRLVLTKRGFVFQRRSDSVLYQGTDGPVQALTWRANLVAWADNSGVRLLDAESWSRIAHVDRPAGARPTLYPTLCHLQPTIVWETSRRLLVAWGDCLLTLLVRESKVTSPVSANSTASDGNTNINTMSGAPAVVIRRTVECTMAWALECVACGVAPLDAEHVVVLGLVPPQDFDVVSETTQANARNEIELQIISRTDGVVVYSDLLPLMRKSSKNGYRRAKPAESAAPYCLLSSFAVPRMENTFEFQNDEPGDVGIDQQINPSLFSAPEIPRKIFRDSHLRWNLSMIEFEEATNYKSTVGTQGREKHLVIDDVAHDATSVDSDDYGCVIEPLSKMEETEQLLASVSPPVMIVTAGSDVVSVRMRDVDDAISSALLMRKAGLALRTGLKYIRRLQKYEIEDLVDEYFAAVLRLPREQGLMSSFVNDEEKNMAPTRLSLRRMKLAAVAMPVLFGGNVQLWERWIAHLEKIPGGLFAIREAIPVRDPKLSNEFYTRILKTMFRHAHETISRSCTSARERLAGEAENHFLCALLCWGTTNILRVHVDLYRYQRDYNSSPSTSTMLRAVEKGLRGRREQTAASYLLPTFRSAEQPSVEASNEISGSGEVSDSLYSVDEMLSYLRSGDARRSESVDIKVSDMAGTIGMTDKGSSIALDAVAKLDMMKGRFDDALRALLEIGVTNSHLTLEDVEKSALSAFSSSKKASKSKATNNHVFVLLVIEKYHLHQCLLDPKFLREALSTSPLFALVRLVGLERLGDFLIEHCVAPQGENTPHSLSQVYTPHSQSDKTNGERRGTLPLDLVAEQLEANQKLLYWYLHLVFVNRPELYVKFPNTANPPRNIVNLHRKAVSLYIKFAGANRDSAALLESTEAYRAIETTTPFLAFLRSILSLGGVSAMEVGKLLEIERKGGAGNSSTFALELAFILEHFGGGTEAEASLILDLLLRGAKSLMLAVAYAQRNADHNYFLWEILIDFCLGKTPDAGYQLKNRNDGALFGSLLEAAALSGADLATLVTKIPPRMSIEGLRPRLVAAVADYRLKLSMHECTSSVAFSEKASLMKESAHRSRRGMRGEWEGTDSESHLLLMSNSPAPLKQQTKTVQICALPASLRPIHRSDHRSRTLSVPIR